MKLVLITNNFPPIVDGVGDYTYHLANKLASEGEQVYVICSKKREIIDYWKDASSLINVLPVVEKWNIQQIVTVEQKITEIAPDWILLQYVPYAYNYYGIPYPIAYLAIRLRLKSQRILITFHEVAIRLNFKQPKYLPVALAQRLIAFGLSLMSLKIVTSIRLYMDMLQLFSAKATKIPVGSNILPLQAELSRVQILKNQLAANGEFILCVFGSNLRRNSLLIHTVARLTRNLYNIKLMFLGKLSEKSVAEITQHAAQLNVLNRIILPGYLKSEDLFLHLICSDVFLQLEEITNTNQGGISTKSGAVAAAYAAGLPIIGTQGDMTDNFFKNNENVILVGTHNEDEILNNIIDLIENDSRLAVMKQNAHYTYHTYLDWAVVVNQYKQLLASCV